MLINNIQRSNYWNGAYAISCTPHLPQNLLVVVPLEVLLVAVVGQHAGRVEVEDAVVELDRVDGFRLRLAPPPLAAARHGRREPVVLLHVHLVRHQVPDETLDLLVALVVLQTVQQLKSRGKFCV